MLFLGLFFRVFGGLVGLMSFAGLLFLFSAMGLHLFPDMPVCSEIYRWGVEVLRETLEIRRGEVISAAILLTLISGVFSALLESIGALFVRSVYK